MVITAGAGVACLCHFCEVHGPTIVMATQAFHGEPGRKRFYGDIESLKRTHDELPCQGCSSIPEDVGVYVSNHHEQRTSYVSTQYPADQSLHLQMKHVCMRVVSCEVYQNKTGPMFLSDNLVSSVYSHTFQIRDSEARGFNRTYGVFVMMNDRSCLMRMSNYLSLLLERVATDIRVKAEKVYQTEIRDEDRKTEGRKTSTTRNLTVLTADPKIFVYVHDQFTRALHSIQNCISEVAFTGYALLEKLPEKKGLVTLKTVFADLDERTTCAVLDHVLRGRTLNVAGSDQQLTNSVIDCFRLLMPSGAFNPLYVGGPSPNETHNFVGYVTDEPPSPQSPALIAKEDCDKLTVRLSGSPLSHPTPMPTIVSKMAKIIKCPVIPDEVVAVSLQAAREDYLSTAKVWFVGADKLDPQKLNLHSSEKEILRFWLSGLSDTFKLSVMTC